MRQVYVRVPGSATVGMDALPEDSVASVSGRALELACAPPAAMRGLRAVYGGRTLAAAVSLEAAGLGHGATLELLPRLLGGGGDGGATGAESRSCYLEMYLERKPDKTNPEEERLARWTTCQLSGMPLTQPVVADELGHLLNKEAVVAALVAKSMPLPLSHISSLKHLTPLVLDANAEAARGQGGSARFACPVTGLPMNGKARFVLLRRTGHVVSERALKEVPSVVEELVGGSWAPEELLSINPPPEELEARREKLLLKRAVEKGAKAAKKKGKAAAAVAAAAANGGAAAAAEGEHAPTAAAGAGAKRAAAIGSAEAAAGVYGGAAARNGEGAASKRFKATELKPVGADDKVWSSLFTSSQTGGHGKNDYCARGASRLGGY